MNFGSNSEGSTSSTLAEQPQAERVQAREMRGNTAIITGGASGLGRAIGLEFARRGVNIALNYIDLPGRDISAEALLTEAALRAHGVEVYCEHCDVRDSEAVDQFVANARDYLGGLHYLVNNAGVHRDGALWRMPDAAWKDVLDTNITGSFNCVRSVAPTFREQRYGKVVNIASHQYTRPGFGASNYATSKAAVVGLTKSAAVELGPYNVNVNAVAPGFLRTELVDALPDHILEEAERRSALCRLGDPEDVAPLVVFLASDEARHITGQVILVDGGETLG